MDFHSSRSPNCAREIQVETEIRRRSGNGEEVCSRRSACRNLPQNMAGLTEVLGGTAPESPRRRAHKTQPNRPRGAANASTIKFRHPERHKSAGPAHGRKPQWVIDWLAQGQTGTDDLRVIPIPAERPEEGIRQGTPVRTGRATVIRRAELSAASPAVERARAGGSKYLFQ